MIDLKFHVYSIVGIFLALAIGMIIGNAMNRDAKLTAENNKIMKRYAETVRILKDDLDKAEAAMLIADKKNDADEAFISSATLVLTENTLSGRKISVVSFGKNDSIINCLKKDIENAGGSVPNVMTIKASFFNDPKNKDTENLLAAAGQGKIEDITQIQTKVYGLYTGLISGKAEDGVVQAFSKCRSFDISGDFSFASDSVVVIVNTDKKIIKNNQAVSLFTDTAKKTELFVCGADTSGTGNAVSLFDDVQIPYVDNADSNLGVYSLIKVLSQKQGRYGLNRKLGSSFPEPI